MSFVLGVVLFALALLISVAWHEAGHMWAAQATGMKVRRYFIGFGPKLWSTTRPSRDGGVTEYGFKAIPAGGFCDIAGMTPYDEISEEDAPRAFYKQATWKRLIVLFAGPAQNFILGFVLVIVLGLGWGLPILGDQPVYVRTVECVAPSQNDKGDLAPCTGPAPAGQAGVQVGDRIVDVNGQKVTGSENLITAIQGASGTVTLTVERDGATRDIAVPVSQVQRMHQNSDGSLKSVTVGAVGVGLDPKTVEHYNAATIWEGAATFTGSIFVETFKALVSLPTKVVGLWHAVTGGQRDVDGPVSIVGASVIGGQAVERGYWDMFLGLLLSVNFFLGAFNLVPLLPLDGGHMAIAIYQSVRDRIRRLFGRPAAGPVDYYKLMPLTYAVVVVMGAFMVLTISADIINPIKVF
ncbi:MAG: M50 family metallopeptidase [Gordonia sp. (in: high G+C Gram-positive bacteria)]|uniref:M50 family metallopeptidase n=1 Tax=Gordonia sp. (in: high G+C Gram-positive bacteria) TaxID=84139 RepID=UPI0039E66D2B